MATNLDYDGDIAILDLGDDENRFSPEFLDEVDAQLEAVLAKGAHGLVTTADSKFYSNGLDLDWLGAHSDQGDWYVGRVQGLLARMLTLPIPTAAAVVGHAFGAGAMLAIAHDFRVMREDRGFFCFPEVDIRIPFTPGMAALIQAKLTPPGGGCVDDHGPAVRRYRRQGIRSGRRHGHRGLGDDDGHRPTAPVGR